MGRWQPDARGRLEQSALELYSVHGFDETTVADIARHAGLTERTYFRHFADKREVLFGGQDVLLGGITDAIAQAPTETTPLDAAAAALKSMGAMFNSRREHSRQRQRVIAANTALQERELIKLATIAGAMSDALRERGVDDPTARLTAETGLAVFKVAWERWIGETDSAAFEDIVDQAMRQLRSLAALP